MNVLEKMNISVEAVKNPLLWLVIAFANILFFGVLSIFMVLISQVLAEAILAIGVTITFMMVLAAMIFIILELLHD